MKTIEIISDGQKVLFTTKSVTFDGKEFLYAHMTNVIHSTEKHIYTFTYDGEVKLLPYEEKDEKTLNAIFSQVQKMAAQKKAASDTVKAGPETSHTEDTVSSEKASEADSEDAADNAAKDVAEDASETEKKDEVAKDEAAKKQEDAPAEDASIKVSDVFGKFKSKKSKEEKPDTADSKPAAAPKDDADAPALSEKPKEDPEKAASRKKSLKVFGIIIAILLVCSVAYYFIFGTPSAPTPANPNTTESQQYDDIDQLIDDLQ